jgi:cold shock CspA family protein
MWSRRAVVGGIGLALSTGLAGCSALNPPNPTVVDTEVEGGIEALFGDTDVYVTVQNDGGAGDVAVTLELLDSEGTVLLDETQTVSFEADERKRVTFSVDVPEDTEEVSASAEAA